MTRTRNRHTLYNQQAAGTGESIRLDTKFGDLYQGTVQVITINGADSVQIQASVDGGETFVNIGTPFTSTGLATVDAVITNIRAVKTGSTGLAKVEYFG